MVSVPTFDRRIRSQCAESIGNAVERADELGLLERVVHRYVGGYDVARARNKIAQEALDEEVDYLWMVDSDMVVPPDALSTLLQDACGVVTGWYVRGLSDEGLTCAIRKGAFGFKDSYRASEIAAERDAGRCLLEVKGNGMGCALVSTRLLRSVKRPWFRYVENADGSALGEDYYFCQQLAATRKPVFVDTRVGCGHIHDRVLEAR